MYMDVKEKIQFIVIVVVLFFAALRFAGMKKEDMELKQHKQQELEIKMETLGELAGINKAFSRLEKSFELKNFNFRDALYKLAQENGVTIISLMPIKCAGYMSVKCNGMSMGVNGDFASLSQFVEKIEKMNGLFFIKQFSFISKIGKNKTGDNLYSAELIVMQYVMGSDKK